MPFAPIDQTWFAECSKPFKRRLREARGRRQRDRRIVGGDRDADGGVLRLHGALGGGDVGPPLSSVEGTPIGTVGSVGMVVLRGMSRSSGFLADQHRNGVGVLGAGHAEADQIGLRRSRARPAP